ncbi:Oidioi.mRNA.OKI2018_I69.YSR.g17119.t1.cds [Oikopleura dioica]|uniref:Oidioi.mRNA.OKI2018_I69.YSR.g17119.t1.cds n=1 Tax=Oikopleura dioica TaxID=34765 RepID=A0ABN7SM17_OIKDI|nr:Oidioi.mRNA.OKI2018_I69.YSR.g17119.t1.cds [Oikopleura dioica]
MACDWDYESAFTPCWAHPRVAETMVRCCNGFDAKNRAVSKIYKLKIRANRTTWENVTAKTHILVPDAPFTTHIRDIILDGIKAAENLDLDHGEEAKVENLFPNVWSQDRQNIEERFARLNVAEATESD